MKIYIRLIIGLIISLAILFIIWRTVFLGTYEMRLSSRFMVSGHYDSEFNSGFLKSAGGLNDFLLKVGSTNYVPDIDYERYMWIYSPHDINKVFHSMGSGIIFIMPTDTPLDGHTVYLVRVRRKEAAGPKPMAPHNK